MRDSVLFALEENGKSNTAPERFAVPLRLTGFKLRILGAERAYHGCSYNISEPSDERCVCRQFTRIGYSRSEFSVRMKTVSIHSTKPHSPRRSRNKVRPAIVPENVQQLLSVRRLSNEGIYTLDKLEYIKAMPELYINADNPSQSFRNEYIHCAGNPSYGARIPSSAHTLP